MNAFGGGGWARPIWCHFSPWVSPSSLLVAWGFFRVFPLSLVVREIVCFVQSSVGIPLSIYWNIFVLGESSLSNVRNTFLE